MFVPVGSKLALPPEKAKPWRSPVPCAATKSAAGKMSRRGQRDGMSDRGHCRRSESRKTAKETEKEGARCRHPGYEAPVVVCGNLCATVLCDLLEESGRLDDSKSVTTAQKLQRFSQGLQ